MAFNLKNYKFVPGKHHDKDVIWVQFPNDITLSKELKQRFATAHFSWSNKCWYLYDYKTTREQLGLQDKTALEKINTKQIAEINRPALQRMHETLLSKGYSKNTIKIYLNELVRLLVSIKDVDVNTLTVEHLQSYMLYSTKELKFSVNSLNGRMNALKFYFEQVLKYKKLFFQEIPRPKSKSTLPIVLSKKEIIRIFEQVHNLKHQIILKLCYGMGLRVSEIVALKISNIDSETKLVHIESSTGKKDRFVPLPKSILESLREYFMKYNPKEFLIEGQHGGQYSIRSVQTIFKTAMRKAKIKKDIGIHGLRHSYATHLLEAGTNLVLIQKLLGHNSVESTKIYAKVINNQISKVKSPLDDF
ncbi:MAG TPA: site-specific integrase [Edaphocola sp.]|nr:site-specific integrase [Edaphocola sp.]